MLGVRDVPATVRYYVDELGWSVDSSYPEGDEPSWARVVSGGGRLMFTQFHYHEGEDPDDDHPVAAALTGSIYLYVDDVEAEWERLRDRVEVTAPLAKMEWGMQEFTVKDINGYSLVFGKVT